MDYDIEMMEAIIESIDKNSSEPLRHFIVKYQKKIEDRGLHE